MGRRFGIRAKLFGIGIETAGDLARVNARLARNLLSVVGERTVWSCRAFPACRLKTYRPQRKGCAVTRSFGTPVKDLAGMLEAVAAYAMRAGEKLRRHGLEATYMVVFMHTSRFNQKTIRTRPKRRAFCRSIE